jgi:cytoskeletal protein RodZ
MVAILMSDWSDFGLILRSTRENLGWTIQDVAHRTRIPAATLRHLEEGDFANFPSPAYAKGFLAQYCEHLDLDAAEQLDQFEIGNPFADLDSYDYLKDHDEHVNAAPLQMERIKRKKEKDPRENKERSGRPDALQPLMVFSVTAVLITGAVFGFMKLSDQLAEEDAQAKQNPESELAPLAGVSTQTPATHELVNVPRALPVTSEDHLVAGVPDATVGIETLNITPTTIDDTDPPPRAVIVDE